MSYKLDLHTHSVASPDGALTLAHYKHALAAKLLDYIAITDHNTIVFALEAQAQLGNQIIIGEEITTAEGEIIGLYLTTAVPAGLTLAESIARIKQQGGLVYVPHPFETVRSGVQKPALDAVAPQIDIVETHNGRAVLQNRHVAAEEWAAFHGLPGAASSDAHGVRGWGKTYSVIDKTPAQENLTALLQTARYTVGPPGLRGMLYPKFNRLRKKVRHAA